MGRLRDRFALFHDFTAHLADPVDVYKRQPMVSSLPEGPAAELYEEWARAIEANNANGVIIWQWDASLYSIIPPQREKGVKIVIPYMDVSIYNAPEDPEDSRV